MKFDFWQNHHFVQAQNRWITNCETTRERQNNLHIRKKSPSKSDFWLLFKYKSIFEIWNLTLFCSICSICNIWIWSSGFVWYVLVVFHLTWYLLVCILPFALIGMYWYVFWIWEFVFSWRFRILIWMIKNNRILSPNENKIYSMNNCIFMKVWDFEFWICIHHKPKPVDDWRYELRNRHRNRLINAY